jgi:Uma2 family endonuclease
MFIVWQVERAGIMVLTGSARAKHTLQDWLNHDETSGYVELIDGEIIIAGGAHPKHQIVSSSAYRWLVGRVPDGLVQFAPVGIFFDADNIPEPDLFWFSAANPGIPGERFWNGIPGLIIEVLSPSTARYDWRAKYELYERFGVREYWIIDPQTEVIYPFSLKDGTYIELGDFEPDETFESPLLGAVDVSAVIPPVRNFPDE